MLILHGDDSTLSRQTLLTEIAKARSSGYNVSEFSGSTLTLADLSSATASVSLLGETSYLVITDLFSRRPSKEKTKLLDFLKKNPNHPLVIWESKDVTAQLTTFTPTAIRKFELPKFLFKFLDNFSLELLNETLQATAPELLFALLIRRVHDLLLAKSQVLTGPAWKTENLRRQAHKFSDSDLLALYEELLHIDYAQKTSASALDLSSALELWVIKALI